MNLPHTLPPLHFIPTDSGDLQHDPDTLSVGSRRDQKILMAHLESTVHWMDNARFLWNTYGARLFVEVGPGDVLSNLIADTLPGSSCIQTCLRASEASTFKAALVQLSKQGHLKEEPESKSIFMPESGKSSEPVQNVPALALQPQKSGSSDAPLMEQIIQREINRFVMDNSGQFLKSNILEAIRRSSTRNSKKGICQMSSNACSAVLSHLNSGNRSLPDLLNNLKMTISRKS